MIPKPSPDTTAYLKCRRNSAKLQRWLKYGKSPAKPAHGILASKDRVARKTIYLGDGINLCGKVPKNELWRDSGKEC
jgi:hypothetical protein